MTDHKTVREALEFYANQKAYRNRNPILDEFDPEACIHGAIHDDNGKRATEALAALDRIESQRTALQAAPEVERTADECDALFNEMMAGIEQNNLEGDHTPFDKKERLAARIFFDFIELNGYLRITKEK